MPHKLIPTASLEIQEGYNTIRDDKELKRNAKEVEAQMEQQGDNPIAFPIRYVKSGSKKYTRNHATLLAAQARGWEQVYATELDYEAGSLKDITDLITSNSGGHPVSRVKQGELYLRMSEGELKPDLENGKKIDPETDYVRKPMSDKEIAEAFKPVYSTEHIRQCKVLAQSSPEIQELMESEAVSANIVVTASQWAKGDAAKQLRILKAAIKVANAEGKDKATAKHLDAVKSDFVKLKAAGGKDDAEKSAEKAPAGDNKPAKGAESESGPDAKDEPEAKDEEAENLFAQSTDEILTEGSKKNKKLVAALATFFADTEALGKLNVDISLTLEECDILAEEVVKIVTNAREVF